MSFILLGILNSQVPPSAGGSFDLLETTILTTTASSVSFSGLGSYSAYKHLQIRVLARNNVTFSNSADSFTIQLNSDTGSNYSWHEFRGLSTSTASAAYPNNTSMSIPNIVQRDGGFSNAYGGAIIDLLDFSNANKAKTIRSISGLSAGQTIVNLASGTWNSTAAVTSITANAGNSFIAGTRFSLYGYK